MTTTKKTSDNEDPIAREQERQIIGIKERVLLYLVYNLVTVREMKSLQTELASFKKLAEDRLHEIEKQKLNVKQSYKIISKNSDCMSYLNICR